MGARKKKGRKQKNRAYYMRYAPKMRRRRQAKTDYYARKTLTVQDKTKYNTPKYRMVVRITNKDVICQVVSSKIIGDEVFCVAYAHELKRYGLSVGLTNYAACYCTGLLLARRLLKKVNMEDYEGVEEVTGEYFVEEADYDEEDPKEPFECYLDVGLRRTTTGARIFAALKGATDGGLKIPHHRENRSCFGKQFPGYFKEDGQESYNADICRKYILGGHVGDYMNYLQKEDTEKYQSHFSKYIASGIGADDLEEMYQNVHKKIREDPSPAVKTQKKPDVSKYSKKKKTPLSGRKDHVLNKILALRRKAAAQ